MHFFNIILFFNKKLIKEEKERKKIATQPRGAHKDSLTPGEVVWLTARARYSQVPSVYRCPRTHPAPPP